MPILHKLFANLRLFSVFLGASVLLVAGGPVAAQAEDWVYRRSYYSHWPSDGSPPPHPIPESRSAYRPAYYREAFGLSVRSAYRINNYVIRNGNRTDRTIYQEGYIEFNP
ncbi:MAG: hypothetical protein SFV23_18155 [Planctomycetaceae bacterium]|nr:hypothetical protein [Planctomycetaceae bacterium]